MSCVFLIYVFEGLVMFVEGVVFVLIENVGLQVGMLVGLFVLIDEVLSELIYKVNQ